MAVPPAHPRGEVSASVVPVVARHRFTGPQLATVLGALGLALALVGMALSDESKIGEWGLIQALHPLVEVGAVLIAIGFAWRITAVRRPGVIEWFFVIAQVFVLHGAPAVVEAQPRFAVAWLHAGFVEHIIDSGTLLTDYDARFSWPGFFTMAAVLVRSTGIDILQLLRWTPIIAEAWIVALVALVVRRLGASKRTATVAAFVYVSTDWIGQTYFAPQTLAILLGLTMLWLVLRFLPRAPQPDGAQGLVWRHFRLVPADLGDRPTAWYVLLLVLGLDAVLSASHQLSPVLLVMQALVLVILLRLRPTVIWWLFGLLTAAWVTYRAQGYWSGHLSTIVGEVGMIGQVFGSALGSRVSEGSFAHTAITGVRGLLTVLLLGLAVVGVVRRWRRSSRVDALVVAFVLTPFLLLAMQSYGGEIMLRVLLYALPFLAVAAAWAFVPGAWATRRAGVALAVVLALCVPMFLVSRWGNESFERMTTTDVNKLDWMYATLPPGASLSVLTPTVPWHFPDFDRFDIHANDLPAYMSLDPEQIRAVLPDNPRGTYIYVTDTQLYETEQFYGAGTAFGPQLTALLNSVSWLKVVDRTDTTTLYQLVQTGGAG